MKPAPAAARAVLALNYLTLNPRSAYTLSELSSALGISPASMSSILLALTDAGYLIRHPSHKTYELGPALVAAGHAASLRHPVVELARAEMPRLAALGTECVGSSLVGDEIVILAIEGRPSANQPPLRIGQRLPLVPPYGQAFLAWSPPDQIRRWRDRLDTTERESFDEALALVRARGYSIGLENPRVREVQSLMGEAARHPGNDALQRQLRASIPEQTHEYVLGQIDPDARFVPSNVVAPIFGTDGTIVYALTVQGIGEIDGAELQRLGEILADACRGITRELGGKLPSLGAPFGAPVRG